MSFVFSKRRPATGRVLTIWYLLLMTLVTGGLLLAGDHMLGKRLLEKDRALVDTLVDNYARISRDAGIDKLGHVLDRDRDFLQLSHYRVRLTGMDGKTRFQSGTAPAESPPAGGLLDDGSWSRTLTLDGHRLQVALAADARQQDLARYRQTMLTLMVSMLLISLVLVALLNHRILRPLRGLIRRVERLLQDGLDQPVPLTASPRSELGQLTLLFNRQMGRIHQLVSSLRHALDSAAHDLRTPLTRQRLSIEQALAQDTPEQWRESLLDCAEENQRMGELIDYLLAITAAEQGLDANRKRPCELSPILHEVADLYELAAEDKDIRLVTDIHPQLCLNADAQGLRQAFANLLDNAIKYTAPGGRVVLSAMAEDGGCRIRLQDSGCGIAEQDLPHIFERLYRGDLSRQSPGHGLGLALVKAVMEAHQARIEVFTDPSGTRVECWLPTAQA
ncbi:sensor histidine kinase [Zobellella aerophila]|uniref:histidine kinase n=1 Tax=Zobellella aerophila TaxID=870480 RepID=A0ABP6V4K3_9GAMM